MPMDLSEMLAPSATAVLTMEVQRNVVGDLSTLPDLRQAVEEVGALANIKELLVAARRAGVRVVHCTVGSDFVPGIPPNFPGAAALARRAAGTDPPPGGADPTPEIGVDPDDLIVRRHHGVAPFTGTDLDALLRRLGVRSVVACGVSLNVGIMGLAIEAVSLGYRVAVVSDAVAGVPVEFGRAVLQNSLPFIATRVTVSDLVRLWNGGA